MSSTLWEEASFAPWEEENKPLLETLQQYKLSDQEEEEKEMELDKGINQAELVSCTRKL